MAHFRLTSVALDSLECTTILTLRTALMARMQEHSNFSQVSYPLAITFALAVSFAKPVARARRRARHLCRARVRRLRRRRLQHRYRRTLWSTSLRWYEPVAATSLLV